MQDGLIVEVGRVDGTARRTIDADGLTVTARPGRSRLSKRGRHMYSTQHDRCPTFKFGDPGGR